MSSTYTDLGIELIPTGAADGTWGTKTNTNLNLIQQAVAGFEQITLSSGGTVALVMSDGAISNARNLVIKFATATIAASTVCTIPDGIEKFYIFDCSGLTNANNLTIKTASGTGFSPTVAGAASSKIFAAYSDGTNLTEISLNTLGGTIATANLEAAAVTTAILADDAVTAAKLSDNAVITAVINDDAVTQAKIADDAVGADQLANTDVTAGSYTTADITVDAQGRITAASSGAAGGGGYTVAVLTNSSGNYTSPANANKVNLYLRGGGGGGAGTFGAPNPGGTGGRGGFGIFGGKAVASSTPYSFTVGSGGARGQKYQPTASAGNATTITLAGPTTYTANAGNGGVRGGIGPGANGTVGSAPGADLDLSTNSNSGLDKQFPDFNAGDGGAGSNNEYPIYGSNGEGGSIMIWHNVG